MPECDFSKVVLQLYWNHTVAWMYGCKFAAYFQNTFFIRTPQGGYFCNYMAIQVNLSHILSLSQPISVECTTHLRISQYSVRMRKNANQKNTEHGHFSRSDIRLLCLSENIVLVFWYFQGMWKWRIGLKYRDTTRNFLGQDKFLGIRELR